MTIHIYTLISCFYFFYFFFGGWVVFVSFVFLSDEEKGLGGKWCINESPLMYTGKKIPNLLK